MADKTTRLILDALSQAAVDPAGVPLHAGKSTSGLFATTPVGKQAAQRCLDEGFLRQLRSEQHGKAELEIVTLSEKGLAYLLSQVSPRQVLEDFVRVLESRQSQLDELLTSARHWQTGFDSLKSTAENVLHHLAKPSAVDVTPEHRNGNDTWLPALLTHLRHRHESGTCEDCPLPELFRLARTHAPSLTIGHFHDGLRQLHERDQIYLHPWTGPLYDLPEPPFALLIGHEVSYYASGRSLSH